MEDLQKELNPEQYKAVTTKDGPILVLAGAGSGKTRVITYRIAYLIEHYGVKPYNILAITFTNKAAKEMQSRVNVFLGEDNSVRIGTFHNVCGKILRISGDAIGIDSGFDTADDNKTEKILKECLKELNIDPKAISVKYLKSIISRAKEKMLSPDDLAANIDKNNPAEIKAVKIYKLYEQKLRQSNLIDFDDYILLTIKLFQDCPDVLAKYQNLYKYIMVDEYQDTNQAQYKLVSLLAAHQNLCVVGDDDQSIYSFRGADITNILNFEKQFPNCLVIKLEQNYRSTKKILSTANEIIANNDHRKEKSLWSAGADGEEVIRFIAENQNYEALFIINEVKRLVKLGKYNYSDFAVLYRQNSFSQTVERQFAQSGIPYNVLKGRKFFERLEISTLLSFLRTFANPSDDIAFADVIEFGKNGIGKGTIDKMKAIATEKHIPLFKVITSADSFPELSRASKALAEYTDKYYDILFELDGKSVPEICKIVMEKYELEEFFRNYDKDAADEQENSRVANLGEFINMATQFDEDAKERPDDVDNSLIGFLNQSALSTDADNTDENASRVNLMTVHSAKGLEYPVVFVIGLEDECFPSFQSIQNNAVDEERRLMYVAVTRAKEKLYLINATERMVNGQTTIKNPSIFLSEIPEKLVSFVDLNGNKITPSQAKKSTSLGSSYNKYYGNSDYLNYGNKEDYEAIRTIKGGGRYGGSSYGCSSYGGKSSYGNSSKGGGKVLATGKIGGENSSVPFGRSVSSVLEANKVTQKVVNPYVDANIVVVGDRVRHPNFGEGVVTKIYTLDSGTEAIDIEFDNSGKKSFAKERVRLKKI